MSVPSDRAEWSRTMRRKQENREILRPIPHHLFNTIPSSFFWDLEKEWEEEEVKGSGSKSIAFTPTSLSSLFFINSKAFPSHPSSSSLSLSLDFVQFFPFSLIQLHTWVAAAAMSLFLIWWIHCLESCDVWAAAVSAGSLMHTTVQLAALEADFQVLLYYCSLGKAAWAKSLTTPSDGMTF